MAGQTTQTATCCQAPQRNEPRTGSVETPLSSHVLSHDPCFYELVKISTSVVPMVVEEVWQPLRFVIEWVSHSMHVTHSEHRPLANI
eukprot:4944290-Amphidinium_carterae.2